MDTRDNNESTSRSSETAQYDLDDQNANGSIRPADKNLDKAHENKRRDDDGDDGDDDNDTDWGNVDPGSGPAPASPGSAV
jgi:hypothetical protein